MSTDLSKIRLNGGSTIVASTPISNLKGQVLVADGATISGNTISFSGGTAAKTNGSGISVEGTFSVDATTVSLDEMNLGRNPVSFSDGSVITLTSEVDLTNSWDFSGTVRINGNGNVLDIRDASALLTINAGACLVLSDVFILDANSTKLVFADTASALKMTSAVVGFDDDTSFDRGAISVQGDSGFILGDNAIIQTDDATFTVEGGTFWIDTYGSTEDPVFGFIDNFGAFTNYVDNAFIRQTTDQSRIIDPAVAALTTGSAGDSVTIQANSEILPDEQIVFDSDTDVSGSGTSMTFSNGPSSQVVVSPGFTATFGDIELLRINQNTFELFDDSNVRFKDNTVLEYVEDVIYDRGTFSIVGLDSQVLLRGLGGKKKITFKTNENGGSGGFSIKSNNLILEDIEIDGLEHVGRETKNFGGQTFEGKIVLTGQSRVNVRFDSDMHFLIRGDNNKLIFQDNDLKLSGKIRFADTYDSTLFFGFNFSEDVDEVKVNLERDVLFLNAQEGLCGLNVENDRVTIVNLSPTSFVSKSRSFLAGQTINISGNPILQESDQFSLESNLSLISEDLLNPIELITTTDNAQTRSLFPFFQAQEYEPIFKGETTRAINVPRARMVIKNSISSKNLRGNISVRPFGKITSFRTHESDPLNLILEGDATIVTQTRRVGRVATIVKDIVSDSTDEDLKDTLKSSDAIYVTGTNNKVVVTGLLQVNGSIIMDENSELIFEFDESTDSEKAIKFGNSQQVFLMEIPKTASIVFQGAGTVLFQDGSKLNFKGDLPETQTQVSDGIFQDNRPNIIFRDYAQLGVDDGVKVNFEGKGKVLIQDNAEVRVINGSLVIGLNSDDFFDFIVDRNAGVRLGVVGSQDYTAENRPARVSLSQGTFNVRFDREAELAARNGGIFETCLLGGVFQNSLISTFKFDRDAKINLINQGMLAFGQEDITQAENDAAKFDWNSTSGLVEGDGSVAIITSASTTPILEAQLQAKTFESESISPFEVVKSQVRITDDLINASDFVDKVDGLTKIITPNDRIVTLDDGDIIRREGPTTGNVYGTTEGGRRFGILPDGTKEFY